jgi:transcriptional regulator with XRE-family HTH domain
MAVYSLRKRREDKGWSQRKAAEVMGTHQGRISRIEGGTALPSLPQAVIIEKIFGIPCRWWVRHEVREILR